MPQDNNSRYAEALEKRIQTHSTEIDALETANRTDEANHKKAARNIYCLFLQLLGSVPDMPAYEAHLDRIPQNWHTARQLAAANGDFTRVTVEDCKLAALDDVLALYNTYGKEGTPSGR